jgi:hypothetical protein
LNNSPRSGFNRTVEPTCSPTLHKPAIRDTTAPRTRTAIRHNVAFLVFDATWGAGFLGNLLKLRCKFGIIGLELYRSVPGKVSRRPEMPLVKLNGKCRIIPVKSVALFFLWVHLVSLASRAGVVLRKNKGCV